jgi:hypothetical protein
VPSCTGMTARLFFMLEAFGPQETAGYVAVQSSSQLGGEIRSHMTYGSAGAHLIRVMKSEVI